ncbi:MAG: hypothetical protein Kow00104_13000 [Rhodothalassiaceae bacterium]
MTRERLEAGALHYLARFAASEERLRCLLADRIARRNDGRRPPDREQAAWIEEIVAKCRRLGLIDDRAYALMRARGRLARGMAPDRIRADLRARGVAEDDLEAAFARLIEESGETHPLDAEAALRFARRRRFGPWRRDEATPDRRKREIAAFARAGFAYGLAARIVDAADEATLRDDKDGVKMEPWEDI